MTNMTTKAFGHTVATMSDMFTTPGFYMICAIRVEAEQYIFIFLMNCIIRPAVCCTGLVSNVISLAILKRSGLHKPSNILLLGLVVADSLYLLSGLNYAAIINMFGPDKLNPYICVYQYDYALDYFLLISDLVITFIGSWGFFASTVIPILITLERLLALFRPMTFKSSITTKRTTIAVTCSFLIWLPWMLSWNSFYVILSVKITQTVTFMNLWIPDSKLTYILSILRLYVINNVVSFLTIAFITLGCCIIWIKMILVLRLKRKLASSRNKQYWSPRTTRTLVLTCVVFAVTHGASSVGGIMSTRFSGMPFYFLNEARHLIYPLNASSSLFVYILSNKKLYKNLRAILRCST
ncbi:G-protein coupled receptor [Biomphalaria glabrata]|nr:G-protein coupled receptor [Biomphalaria glabrata]